MKTIILKRKPDFKSKEYVYRTALESDYKTLIKESCTMIDEDTGELIGVYLVMPKTPRKLLMALLTIRIDKNKRVKGLITKSRIIGWKPRLQITNNFCTSASLATESPKEHKVICDFAKQLSKYYKKYCSEIFVSHSQITKDKILPEWTIDETPFSSGIVNRDIALHYHYDTGNVKNVYSAMVAFKSNQKGGHLAIPEYDIGLEIANNSILLFDGQKILHGVTPFKLLSQYGFRLSVVYYTLQQMWKCEPLTKELARYKDRRTRIERDRLLRLQKKIPNVI